MSQGGYFTRLGPEGDSDPLIDALFEKGFARFSESVLENGADVRYVGDLNGDGFADLISSSEDGEELRIILGAQDLYSFIDQGEIDDVTVLSIRLEERVSSVQEIMALSDFDGDGFDDFAFHGVIGGRSGVHIVYGRTTEEFSDVDGDGIRDAVSSTIVASGAAGVGSPRLSRAVVVEEPGSDGGLALLLQTSRAITFTSSAHEYFLLSERDLGDADVLRLSDVDGGPLFSTDPAEGDVGRIRGYPQSITSVGDVNGDGSPDLAFSHFFDDVAGVARAGRTVVSFGDEADLEGWIADGVLEEASGTSFVGSVRQERSGATIAPIGDFNGDGVDDFAIGTSDSIYSSAINGPANAYVVLGNGGGLPAEVDLGDLSGDDGFAIGFGGGQASRGTPWIVRQAGDFNGDGLDDLLVANRYGSYLVFGRRDDPGSYFNLGELERRDGIYFNVGWVQQAGDLNGDGYDDLVMGRHIYFGRGDTDPDLDNYLAGAVADDRLRAGAGDDTLEGFEGADTLHGETGNDGLAGGAASDHVFGGEGLDTLYGDDGSDELFGEAGADLLFGGRSADRLFGGDGDDMAYGDEGQDRIYGGAGDDTLFATVMFDFGDGETGDDSFNFVEGPGAGASLFGGAGADVLNGGRGGDLLRGGGENDHVYGGVGEDTLRGQKGDDRLEGGEDDDVVRGGGGADRIRGEGGEDRLFGGSDRDRIFGDADADELYGGGGRDRLKGGWSEDLIFGGLGADIGNGGYGDDLIFGGNGADTLRGQRGNDEIYGGRGDDVLVGGAGEDVLFGEEGNDRINGTGSDVAFGGAGDDFISVSGSNAVLVGGAGDDYLRAIGRDGFATRAAFVFEPGDGNDTIEGFVLNESVIAFASGPSSSKDLRISQTGNDALIVYQDLVIRLLNTDEDELERESFVFDLF